MKNISVALRLNLGFGVLVALVAITAVVGIFRLESGSNSMEKLIQNTYAKVLLTNEIQEFNDMGARNLRNSMLATTPKDKADKLKRMDEVEAKATAAFKHLQTVVEAPAERELTQKIEDRLNEYRADREQLLKLMTAGDNEGAVAILFKTGIPKFNAYSAALNDLRGYEKQAMEREADGMLRDSRTAKITMMGVALGAAALGVLLGLSITRSITKPLKQAVTLAEAVASGDLTTDIVVTSTDETGQLLHALKRMNESLVTIVSNVRSSTDTITATTTEIAAGNLDLSSRTEQQAGALEETASSMEELTSTVKQNADNARQANRLAVAATDVAGRGGLVVAQVVGTMASINDSSKKVVDIVGVIDSIAFQTNILALNAAVEAARAGSEGRGFAVVAAEVRNLAQRSAAAAKEIKALIGDSVAKVDAGAELVSQAGATMNEIITSIKQVANIVGEITAASQEQSAGIEQINQAIVQMDQVTQQNAALVEEAAAASQSMAEQADNLAQAVSVFQLEN